ncbi:asporin-like [Microcaecilia unicolor]|uniref:Asporin-like n=1 Tax=Microcaecilia unicolor TaxID=1415580 RepID=A0A6P7YU58_9AMPH|nr:asporin-like [Microcaecilia unicolor]
MFELHSRSQMSDPPFITLTKQLLSTGASFKDISVTTRAKSPTPAIGDSNPARENLQTESLRPVMQAETLQKTYLHKNMSIRGMGPRNHSQLLSSAAPPLIRHALDISKSPTRLQKNANLDLKVLQIKSTSLDKKLRKRTRRHLSPSESKARKRKRKVKTKPLERKKKSSAQESSKERNMKQKDMTHHSKATKEVQNTVPKVTKCTSKKKNTNPTESLPFFEDYYCPPECACYARIVQCSDKGLSTIPYGAPYNARYLLLMNNELDFIQSDLLSEYLSLEFLVLNNNKLTDEAIEGAFDGIQKLTRLYIDENRLRSFPADLPATLLEVRMNANNITKVSESALAACKSLQVVSLNSNKITDESIPTGAFYSLKNLQTIKMSSNFLQSIPSNLPVNLKELVLEENRISSIPNDVFNEPCQLVDLNLSNNQITSEGIKAKAFRNMAKLENLNLSKNLLTVHLKAEYKKNGYSGNTEKHQNSIDYRGVDPQRLFSESYGERKDPQVPRNAARDQENVAER